jgi:hypothetical protein
MVTDPQSWDAYPYGRNNAVIYIDENGESLAAVGLALAAAGAAVETLKQAVESVSCHCNAFNLYDIAQAAALPIPEEIIQASIGPVTYEVTAFATVEAEDRYIRERPDPSPPSLGRAYKVSDTDRPQATTPSRPRRQQPVRRVEYEKVLSYVPEVLEIERLEAARKVFP